MKERTIVADTRKIPEAWIVKALANTPVALILDERKDSAANLSDKLSEKGYEAVGGDSFELLESLAENSFQRITLLAVSTTLPLPEGQGLTSEILERDFLRFFPMIPVLLVGEGLEDFALDRPAGMFVMGRLDRPVEESALDAALARCEAYSKTFGEVLQNRLFHTQTSYVEEPIARVLHDLNNQITGLKGGFDLLDYGLKSMQETKLREKFKRYMEKFIRPSLDNIEQMIGLWRQLRESRLDRTLTSDLEAVARGAIAMAADPVRREKVALTVAGREVSLRDDMSPSRDSSIIAEGDPNRLAQAAANVILNALEAVQERDDGRILVELDVVEENNMCALRVFDNGQGFPEKDRANIWRSFFTTKSGARTGLGLSIAKQIVEKMQGRIESVDSPLGGAGFQILLPRANT